MAHVLVTGANGFIGSHLVRTLAQRGDQVTCLVRKTSNLDRLAELPVATAVGDVTDRESLAGPVAGKQLVFHVGGCIRTLRSREFYEVNTQGMANIAQACAEQPSPPVLVLVSSLAAVGPTPNGAPLREDVSAAPLSHYGRSKRGGELAASRFADRVPISIVRPGGVFGEGDRGCLEMFRPIKRLGVHAYIPTLGVSMIHGQDLVEMILLAAERGQRVVAPDERDQTTAQGYYFAACDEYPMYKEFGRMMGEALGRRRVWLLPTLRPAAWAMAGVNQTWAQIRRRPHVFDIDKAREATSGRWFCSPQTAMDELGFRLGATLAERLRQTADWYLREGWL